MGFDRAFYVTSGPRAYWALATTGGQAAFYRQAEMIEMVDDAYESSGNPAYKRMIVALQRGMVANFGRSWLRESIERVERPRPAKPTCRGRGRRTRPRRPKTH